MIRMFKELKGSYRFVIIIVALLFLQALCDLSLPSYTSDIINVGVQQGGIPDSVPEEIRGELAMPKFRILQTLVDRLNLVSREILTGIPVIRAFGRERHEEERFEEANRRLMKTNLFVNRAMTFMMPVMMLIMNGLSVTIIYSGAHSIDAGNMQVGDMMAFIQYAMQIIMSFLMITMISVILPRASVAAGRIQEVLDTEVSIHTDGDPETPQRTEKGSVVFDHVSFAYPGAGEEVLTDISFTAEKGETVAFIGSTGSGKSTLVNLIPASSM